MQSISRLVVFTLFFALFYTHAWADKYKETEKMFSDAGIASMFKSAHGFALFPTIGKAGVVVGGAYGQGRVYEQGNYIGDAKMRQLSVGLQLGASGFSQVVFFQDKRALSEFTSGNFEFGAEASAVALTSAAGASANTAGSSATASGGKNNAATGGGGYNKGMATYTIVKGGAMFEISLGGQSFKFTKRAQ